MTKEFTNKFFSWAKENRLDYEAIAKKLDNKASTIKNWNSIGIPKGKQYACKALMDNHSRASEETENSLNLKLTDEQLDLIETAAAIVQTPLRDYIIKATTAQARKDKARNQTPNLMIADTKAEYGTSNNIIDPTNEENSSGGKAKDQQA